SGVEALSLLDCGPLEFLAPDETRFPCLRYGREAAQARGAAPVVLNAANEVAVQAFLDRRISFARIPAIIAESLARHEAVTLTDMDTVLAVDGRAREMAESLVASA
ncbi:MAG: 1-deoxy-D-xylulose-5-phosphate reductoisomerase, partial [Natronospirillum sp.]